MNSVSFVWPTKKADTENGILAPTSTVWRNPTVARISFQKDR
jgi:hypothetical protein